MNKWITHRLPTARDADDFGHVLLPHDVSSKPDKPNSYKLLQEYTIVTLGQRWWPANANAAEAAAAEQEAAAANPDPTPEQTPEQTPEPAAEPSPAVAGVPSDQELWRIRTEAAENVDPSVQWLGWSPENKPAIAAHRALYDYGYRRCLEEAKATSEPNRGLASDLTALQEENAQLKSKIKELHGEIREVCGDSNGIIGLAEAKQRQFDDACKRIAELEHENTKLKDVLKDLLHSGSQPQMVVVGDLEGELKRRGGEVKLEPESEPAPETDVRTADGFSCGGCSWFVLRAGDAGHCRKHAPAHNGFPPVFVDGWCGDFIDANDAGPAIPQSLNPISIPRFVNKPVAERQHRLENGLTVAQLKKILADWPEVDKFGNPLEVWLSTENDLSSQAKTVSPLNTSTDASGREVADIILES